ncbi:ATP-dependent protease LonB, partial [bacterium]
TGEVSIRGSVRPIGGVVAKVEAARQAGAAKVLVPKENYQAIFKDMAGIEVIPVDRLEDVFKYALKPLEGGPARYPAIDVLSASTL